jgi:nitroreductase
MKTLGDQHQVANPLEVSTDLLKIMSTRRSIRSFSSRPVAPEIMENAVKIAASATSGAFWDESRKGLPNRRIGADRRLQSNLS